MKRVHRDGELVEKIMLAKKRPLKESSNNNIARERK